jgi:hypothetical protein
MWRSLVLFYVYISVPEVTRSTTNVRHFVFHDILRTLNYLELVKCLKYNDETPILLHD